MSFIKELKRRNVVRVGLAYMVIGWVLAQVAEFAFENFGAPDWVLKSFVVLLLLGLPVALLFAWAFEITPEGVKREKDVNRDQSITKATGRKLDFTIIAVLVIAVGLLLADKFLLDSSNTDDDVVRAAEGQSIAVLPFVNMSNDEDYFADGLTEELLNLLAQIPDLKVAGRTSSFVFKDKTDDLRTIGAALDVQHVLEGSVRRSGDRLRVTAQLIKVDDGFHLWSETYDRQMADIFDIQDDVASAITEALRLHFSPRDSRPTKNPDAYALYLEALPYIANNDREDVLDIVVDLLDRAVALDPEFAKAYEAKAFAHWMVGGEQIDGQTARLGIMASATLALQYDPSLVLARLLVEAADLNGGGWLNVYEAGAKAIKSAPDEFNVVRNWCYGLMIVGYLQQALDCSEHMVELEPLSSLGHYRTWLTLNALGRHEESSPQIERAAELSGEWFRWDLMLGNLIAGQFPAASLELARAEAAGVSELKLFYSWSSENLQEVLQGIQNADDGEEFLRQWVTNQLVNAHGLQEENTVYFWYLAFGYIDDFWRVLNDIGLSGKYAWTSSELLIMYGLAFPETGFIRHPAYLEYAKISGLTAVWDKYGPPEWCSKTSGEWVCE